MKKSDFITLLLGVVGGLLFSLGMCMCLLPQWNVFREGVVVTALGAVILVILAIVRFRMSGRKMKKINWKTVGKVVYGVFASLVLGVGMSLVLVAGEFLWGIVLGIVGIVLLLCLIPMCVGLHK